MSTETGTAGTRTFLLPDLGEGLTEAELVNWLVDVGDPIKVDQPIAEVETAKSMVEVPSPYAGTVVQLHGEPGDMLDVGKPLISVRDAGAAEAASAPAEHVAEQAAEAYREEEKAGSGNVLIGYGTSGEAVSARRTRARKAPMDQGGRQEDLALLRTRVPGKIGAVISPLVRRMAKENGVDLSGLHGSGESGLIMRRDVEAAIGGAEPAAADLSAPFREGSSQEGGHNAVDARTGLGIAARTPFAGVRKAVASNMSRSRSEIPEATVWVDVDATALVELRHSLKTSDEGAPGLLAFIARFVTAGLKKFPELNTRIEVGHDGKEEIVSFDGVNLGFAAQTDRGLMVPSIRSAEKLSARELDTEIRRLTAVVREGRATPTELGSGTFTLNNYGVFGVDGSAAIINYPEVAILGVGRIMDRPWVVDGELAVRKVTELTLAFDHRVCDGATAGGFLRFVADAIENPGSILADL